MKRLPGEGGFTFPVRPRMSYLSFHLESSGANLVANSSTIDHNKRLGERYTPFALERPLKSSTME